MLLLYAFEMMELWRWACHGRRMGISCCHIVSDVQLTGGGEDDQQKLKRFQQD